MFVVGDINTYITVTTQKDLEGIDVVAVRAVQNNPLHFMTSTYFVLYMAHDYIIIASVIATVQFELVTQ